MPRQATGQSAQLSRAPHLVLPDMLDRDHHGHHNARLPEWVSDLSFVVSGLSGEAPCHEGDHDQLEVLRSETHR